MMFERFTQAARDAVTEAATIARDMGASSIEAEHVLLAVAGGSSPAAHALSEVGLDPDGLRAALIAETTRSLAAVGMSADALTFSPFVKTPKFGTSAKLVLERSLRVAIAEGDKHISDKHLVLGALRAPTGTVPRTLECANVDRATLTQTLTALSA